MTEQRTLYANRALLNSAAVHKWATLQGFKSALPGDELHVTIAYSKDKLAWPAKRGGKLKIAGGRRSIEKFGDAVVLRFSSGKLQDRWQELRDAGASYDFASYKPHVTITYELPKGLELDDVAPYRGELVFGPERFEPIVKNATDDIDEKKLKGQGMAKLDAADRKALPKSEFGLPGQKKYPMPDSSHAANAKARATQMHKRGIISDAELARIDAKANKVMGKG